MGGWLGSSGDAARNASATGKGAQNLPLEASLRGGVRRDGSPSAVSQLTASLAAGATADERTGRLSEPVAGQASGREFTFSPRSSQSDESYIRCIADQHRTRCLSEVLKDSSRSNLNNWGTRNHKCRSYQRHSPAWYSTA